jgi:hypothetical protein
MQESSDDEPLMDMCLHALHCKKLLKRSQGLQSPGPEHVARRRFPPIQQGMNLKIVQIYAQVEFDQGEEEMPTLSIEARRCTR